MAQEIEFVPLDLKETLAAAKKSGIRNCAYCGLGYGNLTVVKLKDAIGVTTLLHHNCVVAFATRILNEFEKL